MTGMKDAVIFRGSFNRPNLHYSVRPKPATKKDSLSQILKIINEEFRDESGIVYALKIKDCVEIFEYLKENGVSCLPYHGDISNDLRDKTQTKWLEDKCQVVIATLAFGLGINKADVSFVIHYTISQSIQNYYQESGRAGRDGATSNCILLYKPSDCFSHIAPMIAQKTDAQKLLKPIMEYAHNMDKCRRNLMAKSFNEEKNITSDICAGVCDVCDGGNADEYQRRDITDDAVLINKIVSKTGKSTLSMAQLVDVWRGSSSSVLGKSLISELRIEKMKSSRLSKAECEYIIGGLFVMSYLNIDTRFTTYQAVCVIVAGRRAFTLTDMYRKNKEIKVMINLPVLGKRKRSKLNSGRKKMRSKSAINSNCNNNNKLSSQNGECTASNSNGWMNVRRGKNVKGVNTEPNKKRGRKRKREQVLNLCSDDDDDSDVELYVEVKSNRNKKQSLNTSKWELSDDDDESFTFDFDADCKKEKKVKVKKSKKKKRKKKRLSDVDECETETEAPKRKRRKLTNKKRKTNKKPEANNTNSNNNICEIAVPEKYADNSLEYKMFSELHSWNRLKNKALPNDDIARLLDNLSHVLSEEQLEIERIIGMNKWRKFGKDLLREIKRVRAEYNNNMHHKQQNNNHSQNASVIHNNSPNSAPVQNDKHAANHSNNIAQTTTNNTNNWNRIQNNNVYIDNSEANNNINHNENGNKKQRVITQIKIAESLRNRNAKSPSLTSSFCPASLVNNNNNKTAPISIARQRRNSAPKQQVNNGNKNKGNNKRGSRIIHNSALHKKLLSTTSSSSALNNDLNDNGNCNGFEYPDSSDMEDNISTPRSSTVDESPLFIRQRQENKRSASSRSAKLKLNFQ